LTARFADKQLVLLGGPLGAGKTQFVKSCVAALGGGTPESPTFSLINEYQVPGRPTWHVDLYRLQNEVDIDSTGFWDLFGEERGLIFVEWPERVDASSWPLGWARLDVQIDFTDSPDRRRFSIQERRA
jgi:tRNA threonylcarbamoyladenosine biosynthesis protein TsaE